MLTFVLALISFFPSGAVAQRAGTTTGPLSLGCYGSPVPAAVPNDSNAAGCNAACKAAGYVYSWQKPSTDECQCSQSTWGYPNAQGDATGLQLGGIVPNCQATDTTPLNCQTCVTDQWRLAKIDSTFTRTSGYVCYSFDDVGLQTSQYTAVPGAPECLTQCARSAYVFLSANTITRQWMCYCSNTNLVAGVATGAGCGPGSVFAMVHSLPAQVSALTRRREIAARAARKRGFCPSGLTACQVPGSDAYECLDTQRELGSCGGCVNGAYRNSTALAGYNCETFGSNDAIHSCVNGKCVPQGCRHGKILRNGICV